MSKIKRIMRLSHGNCSPRPLWIYGLIRSIIGSGRCS